MKVRIARGTTLVLALLLPLFAGAQARLVRAHGEPDVMGGSAFVITDVNGVSSCREATAEESRSLRNHPAVPMKVFGETRSRVRANAVGTSEQGLNIILRGTAQLDANPEAKAAFERAAAVWESRIANPITVYVDVDYGTQRFGEDYPSANIIGSTSSSSWLFSPGDYAELKGLLQERADNPLEAAVYNALPSVNVPTDIVANGGLINRFAAVSIQLRALDIFPADANDDDPEDAEDRSPQIGFNSAFKFDFNPDDGISAGLMDFVGVAVHEMGHMLGFASRVGAAELATPTQTVVDAPTILDLFRFRPGVDLAGFQNAQRILTTGGEQVFFAGKGSYGLSTGNPKGENGDEQQASHWRDDSTSGVFIGIMDPTLSRARRVELTKYDLEAFDIAGFTLKSPGCAELEPNDVAADANAVPFDAPCTGTVGSNDSGFLTPSSPANSGRMQDLFKVTLPSSGKLNVTLQYANASAKLDVYLVTIDGSTITTLGFSNGNTTTENFETGTLPAGDYYIGVSATGSTSTTTNIGVSTYTLTTTATGLLPPAPAAPSNLSATSLSPTSVGLTWLDNSNNETEFRIEQKTAGGAFVDVGGVPADFTEFVVTGVSAATTTAFRVRARNAGGDSAYSTEALATTPSIPVPCVPGPTSVCLVNDRFKVSITYLNQFATPAQAGVLLAAKLLPGPQNPDTATFGFGSAQAIEVVVRIQDARPFGANRFDVYFGGMTDVEYTATVQDTVTGTTRLYHNAPGQVGGGVDRESFPSNGSFTPAFLVVQSASLPRTAIVRPNVTPTTCAPNANTTCLVNNRFQVKIDYLNQFANPPQPGQLLGARFLQGPQNPDTGTFGFGSAQAIEVVVRIQDARPFGVNRFDIYYGGMTDVEFTVTVTDTVTGASRQYRNPPGTVGGGVDRASFPAN